MNLSIFFGEKKMMMIFGHSNFSLPLNNLFKSGQYPYNHIETFPTLLPSPSNPTMDTVIQS